MSAELPSIYWPRHSLLDGPFAREWSPYLGDARVPFVASPATRQASHRATTSSRTPGKVNRGTVYAQAFEHDANHFHLCGCGQTQHVCTGCLTWTVELRRLVTKFRRQIRPEQLPPYARWLLEKPRTAP